MEFKDQFFDAFQILICYSGNIVHLKMADFTVKPTGTLISDHACIHRILAGWLAKKMGVRGRASGSIYQPIFTRMVSSIHSNPASSDQWSRPWTEYCPVCCGRVFSAELTPCSFAFGEWYQTEMSRVRAEWTPDLHFQVFLKTLNFTLLHEDSIPIVELVLLHAGRDMIALMQACQAYIVA